MPHLSVLQYRVLNINYKLYRVAQGGKAGDLLQISLQECAFRSSAVSDNDTDYFFFSETEQDFVVLPIG